MIGTVIGTVIGKVIGKAARARQQTTKSDQFAHSEASHPSAMANLVFANGDRMASLGLGTWKAEAGEVGGAVSAALELGYRHLDCASMPKSAPAWSGPAPRERCSATSSGSPPSSGMTATPLKTYALPSNAAWRILAWPTSTSI